MQFHPLSSSSYSNHRHALSLALLPDSIAILHSNDLMPKSADQYFPFRQNSDLLRLCGIYLEDTALVLYPEHPDPDKRELLFIRRTGEYIKTWEGDGLDQDEAAKICGIRSVHWMDQFESIVYPWSPGLLRSISTAMKKPTIPRWL